jgi:acetyltransferase-like isoleucine patch superfamily enzyme
MSNWYRYLATSDDRKARAFRRFYRGAVNFSVPAPRFITVPAVVSIVAIRSAYYFLMRVFICEPLFKAYCTSYGRNFHTGVFLHWVQGKGDIVIGDNVTLDGRSNIFFAARFCERPVLRIGDNTGFGHQCAFSIGKEIRIGKHCRFASNITLFDSSGHPADPVARMKGEPPSPDDVRPIIIGDNVWVGTGSTIYPGVTIGDNSIVSAGAVVMNNVPANTVVAGNPARMVRSLTPATQESATPTGAHVGV